MKTVTLPDDLVDAVQRVVGAENVNAFAARALETALRNRELDNLLAELVEEVGPVPPQLEAEAEAAWRAS